MNKLTESAPERIWLQVNPSEVVHLDDEPLDNWTDCTWCSESVGGSEVDYVRADIADREIEPLPEEKQNERD